MNLYFIARTLCNWLILILFRMRYEGLENIPRDKGYILACNHRSNFDALFIVQGVQGQLYFMAKIELFKNPVLRWAMLRVGAFPVERGTGDTGAMDTATRIVRDGGVLGMFPEGHRSKDGVPLRARSGVAMVSAQTGADVLPCAVVYGKKLAFRSVVTIRYGEMIPHAQLALETKSPSSIRRASKRIMDDIIELLGYKEEGKALDGEA